MSRGPLSDYVLRDLGGGRWLITDTVEGRDGQDILTGVESAVFLGSGDIVSLLPPPPAPVLSEKEAAPLTLPTESTAKDAGALVLPGVMDDLFLAAHVTEQPAFLADAGSGHAAPSLDGFSPSVDDGWNGWAY